jgi:hypothetical protein
LAAHTSANWEGVKVSVRGRVSMGALRQEQPQAKAVQGKWSNASPNGLATPTALGGAGPFRGWRLMAAINRLACW